VRGNWLVGVKVVCIWVMTAERQFITDLWRIVNRKRLVCHDNGAASKHSCKVNELTEPGKISYCLQPFFIQHQIPEGRVSLHQRSNQVPHYKTKIIKPSITKMILV